MFNDVYEWHINNGFSEEEARENADWAKFDEILDDIEKEFVDEEV